MFGTDRHRPERMRLLYRVLDHFFGARRLRETAEHHEIGSASDEFFNFETDFARVAAHLTQNGRGHAGSFFDKAEKNMFRSDVLVVKPLSFLIRQLHHLPRAFGKSFVSHIILSVCT